MDNARRLRYPFCFVEGKIGRVEGEGWESTLFFQLSIIVLGVTEEKTLPNLIWA